MLLVESYTNSPCHSMILVMQTAGAGSDGFLRLRPSAANVDLPSVSNPNLGSLAYNRFNVNLASTSGAIVQDPLVLGHNLLASNRLHVKDLQLGALT